MKISELMKILESTKDFLGDVEVFNNEDNVFCLNDINGGVAEKIKEYLGE